MKWVKLKKYCQLSGDTPQAIHARRHKRQWLDGVHSKVGPDGNLWVNIIEVEKWVEKNEQVSMKAYLRG